MLARGVRRGHNLRMREDSALSALELLASCDRYARWLFDLARPHLGQRVVEAGSGIGTQSALLVGRGFDEIDAGSANHTPREIVLTDCEPRKVDLLRERFEGVAGVRVSNWRLPDPFELGGFVPDTFVMWNVLEHVADDLRALAEMRRALAPGGRVIIFSPAGRRMMSALDRGMGHFRRYGRRELARKARAAGLVPLVERTVNLLGAAGWWANACFLGRRGLPRGQSLAFDLIVPALRLWEDRMPVPWGLSVLFVAEKAASAPPVCVRLPVPTRQTGAAARTGRRSPVRP